jgi:glucoamylase
LIFPLVALNEVRPESLRTWPARAKNDTVDGPALRANALITWSNFLLGQNNASYVTNTLWPIIKLDLDYVKANWNQSTCVSPPDTLIVDSNKRISFDLWEEVSSSSFFTTAIQHRSLRQGVALANAIGQTSVVSDYTTQANNLLCFLQVCLHFAPQKSDLLINLHASRTGITLAT